MKKLILFFLLLTSSSAFAQQAAYNNLFTINTSDNSLFNELNQYADDYRIINVNVSDKNSILNSKPEKLRVNLPVSSSESVNIELEKFEVFTPDATIKAANGEILTNAKNSFVAYTGSVPGVENSLVTLTMGNDELRGILVTKNATYVLGKISDNRASESDYVFYQTSKMKVDNPFMCYTGEEDISADVKKKITEMQNTDMSGLEMRLAKVAIEVDNYTYAIYSSSTENVTNYVMSIMATVSAIYLREVKTKIEVPHIRIWTTPDPYTATTSNAYLNQFRSNWNSTMQSQPRTIAHMISRKFGSLGGIAWVNVLCNSVTSGNGYGYSNTNGTINNFPVYSWDIMVVAHEIGHNFGSPHTHSCTWPGGAIDSCYEVEGSCYTGPVIPRSGTIMSYCHLTSAGIDLDKGFGPLPKQLIRNRAENAACMTNTSAALLLTYPVAGMILSTQSIFRVMWASSESGGNVNLTYTTNNGSSWSPIASNVSLDSGYYNWQVPYIQTSSQCKIRIVNSANASIADTSDLFSIKIAFVPYSITYPTQFLQIQTSPTNTNPIHFTWTRPGSVGGIQYKLKIRKAGNNPDYVFLSNNGGSDSVASIRISQLDSIAKEVGTVGDSVWLSTRVWGYLSPDSTVSANSIVISIKRTVGITQISEIVPDKFALYHNFPNPFNPTTNIKFDVPELTNVKISIYDISGKEVASLVNKQMSAGSYTADWNAANFSSGIYFYRMTTDKFVETRKMMLIK